MIFDGHGDVWTDVTAKRVDKQESDIFRRYHLEKFRRGKVTGGIFVIWIDPPYDKDPAARSKQVVESIQAEMKDAADLLNFVTKYEDFQKGAEAGKINVVTGIEGLAQIGEDIDQLDYLYQAVGARHAMLTWNDRNALATGCPQDPQRGLTEVGKRAVRRMEKLGMVLDVSHLNDKSFWDLMSVATTPVIASHSNARAVCPAKRNLADDMLKEIARTGGLVGMNSLREFVGETKAEQNVFKLADHVDYIANLIGVEHIGLGFDFDDYLEGEALSSFSSHLDSPSADGIENEAQAYNLITELEKRGYSQKELEAIAYGNFYRVFRQVLK